MKILSRNSTLSSVLLGALIGITELTQVNSMAMAQSDPLARAATSQELKTLTALANVNAKITSCVVAGSDAALTWSSKYVGGEALFVKTNGQWNRILKTGGSVGVTELPTYFHGMSTTTANSIDALIKQEDGP